MSGANIQAWHENKTCSFNEVLQQDISVSIHHKDLQALTMEIYKISSNMSPTILNDIFRPRAIPYNLRTYMF